MEVTFRTRLAFGADPAADPAGWSWTDVSADPRTESDPAVTVTAGRGDETTIVDGGSCELKLRNPVGDYTPHHAVSQYWPYVRRNTPLWVEVDDGVTGWVTQFQGFVTSWCPRWSHPDAADATVEIKAHGVLGRLAQASTPLRPPLTRAVLAASPAAAWMLGDGEGATQAGNLVTAGAPMLPSAVTALPKFAAADAPAGAGSAATCVRLVDAADEGYLSAAVSLSAATLTVSAWVRAKVATPGALTHIPWLSWVTNGTFPGWQVALEDTGTGPALLCYAVDTGGTGVSYLGAFVDLADEQWHCVEITIAQDGAHLDLQMWADGVSVSTYNGLAGTLGTLTHIKTGRYNGAFYYENTTTVDITGLAIYGSGLATSLYEAGMGYPGESAGDRITRLCAEEGVAVTLDAGDTMSMGAQIDGSLLTVLRDCESADLGLLTEDGWGLRYTPRTARYNATTALTINVAAGQLDGAPEPAEDDQRLRNDVTVSRPGGSSGRHVDDTHVTACGRYGAEVSANIDNDFILGDMAAWLVGLGTVDEMRYERIGLNFANAAGYGLLATWLACGIGSRLAVTGLGPQHPPDGVDAFVEGYETRLGKSMWEVTLNVGPARPYDVFVRASASRGRRDAAYTTLSADITATAMSVSLLTPSGALWTADPAQFPVDVEVGGERITVSGMSGAGASAVTFVAAGAGAEGDNASVTPGAPAGVAAGDVVIIQASIRSSGTGTVDTPVGWRVLLEYGNCKLLARVWVAGDAMPTITFTSGSAGDTTLARGYAIRGLHPALAVAASATQLNASAQDIAYPALVVPYPGCLIVYYGWKQDDYTSVATIAGATSLMENDSTLGSDAGQVVQAVAQSAAANIAAGSMVVTGGGAAISRGVVLALRTTTQVAAVSARAVNGVAKAHSAGAQVRLWHAPVRAL